MRPSGRAPQQLRTIRLTRNYTKHAEGSVLVEFGDTKVICTASIDENVPRWMKGKGQGWVTGDGPLALRRLRTAVTWRNDRHAPRRRKGTKR